jgi:outer membrane protein OmpU
MNNLKKVGLTALATSMIASSAAYAGEMSVSGSASLKYTGLSTNSDVNPFSMGDSINFVGGGDLDNGMSVQVTYELDGGNFDDYKLVLDTNGMGALTFSGASVNAGGITKVNDIVPTAYTPVYEDTDGDDNGLATSTQTSTTGMFGYTYSDGGLMLSVGYQPNPAVAAEAETSYAVSYDGLMDGLTLVAGMLDDGNVSENTTFGVKYTMGSITAAYQRSDITFDAQGSADEEGTHYGVSFAVNENLSVSAGRQETSFDSANTVDEENTGWSASYTMGSMAISAAMNKVENAAGSETAKDHEVTLINVAFAF